MFNFGSILLVMRGVVSVDEDREVDDLNDIVRYALSP